MKKSELKQIIKEEIKNIILKEKFGDMAEFTIGAERNGEFYNVQLMIHNKVVKSKKVKLNDKLYEDLFDYCESKLK